MEKYKEATVLMSVILLMHFICEYRSPSHSLQLLAALMACIAFIAAAYIVFRFVQARAGKTAVTVYCVVEIAIIMLLLSVLIVSQIPSDFNRALAIMSQIEGSLVMSFVVFNSTLIAAFLTTFTIILGAVNVFKSGASFFYFILIVLSSCFYFIQAIKYYKDSEEKIKNAEKTLSFQKALFMDFFNKLSDAAIILSPDTNIEFINNACKSNPFNITDSLTFYNFTKKVTRESDSLTLCNILSKLTYEKSEKVINKENMFQLCDGNTQKAIKVLFINSSECMQYGILLIDETDKNEKEKIRLSHKYLSMTISNLSHELRTPMNGLMSTVENATKIYPNDELIESLFVNARLLMVKTEDFLDFSLMQSGEFMLNERSFKIESLLSELSRLYKASMSKNGFDLFICVLDLCDIYSDYERILQVLSNMLSHALRYAEKNGRIELCVSLDVSKKIKFEVAHAIQKAEVSIKADINDNICKLLVDMLGGTLNSSINSDCATYWFCIESSCPVETDLIPCEYQPSENLIGMRPSFCSYKSDNIEEETALFVIDDNSTNRQALKYILKTSNAAIFEAVNGKDAVKMFIDYGCKYKYWVVFMDIDMPVMDGIEAARQLKGISHDQLKVHIKIYIITAYDTLQHRLICSQAGVEGFFTKPISYDKIKEILKLNHLDLRG